MTGPGADVSWFMSLPSLDEFRQLVLREPTLQRRLSEPTDLGQFLELVLREGKEHGFDFTPEDLRQALNASRRAWLERWI